MNADLHETKFIRRWHKWFKIADGNTCWEWSGPRINHGYGIVTRHGRKTLVHRLSYERYVGPIPNGLNVLHRCDNPPCANPSHLYAGTQQQNIIDSYSRNRRNPETAVKAAHRALAERKTCKRGHPRSHFRQWKNGNGRTTLRCITCKRITQGRA